MSARHIPSTLSFFTLFKIVAVILGLLVLWLIRDILLYFFLAILLAGVIYPLANWGARHRIPKLLSVLVIYLVIFGGIALVVTLVIPALLSQSESLLVGYGGLLGNATDAVKDLNFLHQIEAAGFDITAGLASIQGQVQAIFGNVFSLMIGIFGGIAGFVVVLVLALYMVIEDSAIKKMFQQWVPKGYQEFSTRVAWLIMDKLGGWMRGQLLLCLLVGLSYLIAFSALRLPYALLLAVLGGIFEFVPYIGPILAAIPALLIAFNHSPALGLAVLVAVTLIQQLENNLLVPKIMERVIGLNPIVSIMAFLIGAKLFGAVGAIIGIPVAVAMVVAITEWREFRRTSPIFRA